MTVAPYVVDRTVWDQAAELIERHGSDACEEAAARAQHSRHLGNLSHFCRWRQIEYLIAHLAENGVRATRH